VLLEVCKQKWLLVLPHLLMLSDRQSQGSGPISNTLSVEGIKPARIYHRSMHVRTKRLQVVDWINNFIESVVGFSMKWEGELGYVTTYMTKSPLRKTIVSAYSSSAAHKMNGYTSE